MNKYMFYPTTNTMLQLNDKNADARYKRSQCPPWPIVLELNVEAINNL